MEEPSDLELLSKLAEQRLTVTAKERDLLRAETSSSTQLLYALMANGGRSALDALFARVTSSEASKRGHLRALKATKLVLVRRNDDDLRCRNVELTAAGLQIARELLLHAGWLSHSESIDGTPRDERPI
jgi:DNA-binding MarR family transcriptional regulator